MNMTNNYSLLTAQPEYDTEFWNHMRNKPMVMDTLAKGRNTTTGSYEIPATAHKQLAREVVKESAFRNISTVICAYKTGYKIMAKDCKDKALFVPEGGVIPIYEGIEDFTKLTVDSFKLVSFVKLNEEFVQDAYFDIEKHLIERFGKCFAKAEDDSFINGNGTNAPTGILHDTKGAGVAFTINEVTYDDVISLYFAVPSEYRSKGVWLMNDATALALRKLKDADGNYLWNSNSDTILGKQVIVSEFMPDMEPEKKPIAFGDFSYYWVVDRKPFTVRTLTEKFTFYDQIGYLAMEFLDGKLVRKEAIKVIQMENSKE